MSGRGEAGKRGMQPTECAIITYWDQGYDRRTIAQLTGYSLARVKNVVTLYDDRLDVEPAQDMVRGSQKLLAALREEKLRRVLGR